MKNPKDIYRELGSAGEKDQLDVASNLALAEASTNVSNMQAARANIVLDAEFDGVHCVECGLGIPKDRIRLLKMSIPMDGRKTSSHPTDKIDKIKGGEHNILVKHGTDKCVDCASEAARLKAVSGRQYAR